ncbi:hypothetical protein C5167_000977 [Papaver somniferum]|uniref:Hydrophobic seed protein domain-containing protein n=1 Tax=Papaver somniferum TaxID=3469 RepID=A0A4Y7KU22_PAPSO|nr:hypothetical protein C5167_000977 [Papaver somniferum]
MAKICGSSFLSFFFVLAVLFAAEMATTEAQLVCDVGKLVILGGGPCTTCLARCLKKYPLPLLIAHVCVPVLGTDVCACCLVDQTA